VNTAARHLAVAVEHHCRWARDNGITVPADLLDLVRIVSGGQDVTNEPDDLDLSDDAGMSLAVDYRNAGRLLGGVSARTVRRLVDDGELRSVPVGARRVIPRTELVAYLERWLAEKDDRG
jgi:excisionase family DNA binding protein